jgi:hypothetical protein
MMPAADDVLTPTDIAIDGYEKAREPKKLVILPGGHFDAYVDGFGVAGPAAVDWFTQHLLQHQGVPPRREGRHRHRRKLGLRTLDRARLRTRRRQGRRERHARAADCGRLSGRHRYHDRSGDRGRRRYRGLREL